MPVARRFLISPSLARLIQKERGAERVVEGHFTPQSGRQSHVRIEPSRSYLVLTSLDADPEVAEARSDLPDTHAKALLEVCPGTIGLDRTILPLHSAQAAIERVTMPGQLDVVSVEFATQADAGAFSAPLWFGQEVTNDPAYLNRELALAGLPSAQETELSNAALEAALDVIEGHSLAASSTVHDGADPSFDEVEGSVPLGRLDVTHSAASMPIAAGLPQLAAEEAAEAAGEHKAGRPVLNIAPASQPEGDERIASLFDDLAAAVSSSTIESVRSGAELRDQRKWRWSTH